jgi:hypothetical protein
MRRPLLVAATAITAALAATAGAAYSQEAKMSSSSPVSAWARAPTSAASRVRTEVLKGTGGDGLF